MKKLNFLTTVLFTCVVAVAVASPPPAMQDAVLMKEVISGRKAVNGVNNPKQAKCTDLRESLSDAPLKSSESSPRSFAAGLANVVGSVPETAIQMTYSLAGYQFSNDAEVKITGDSIFLCNFFGWGTTIKGEVNKETGLFSIKPQLVYQHSEYGAVNILSCDPVGNTYNSENPIPGLVEDDKVTLGSWVAIIMEGEYKGYSIGYGLHDRSEFRAPNAKMTSIVYNPEEGESPTVSSNLWAEAVAANAVNLYNFGGTGAKVTIYTRGDKSCYFAPTQLFSNSYGSFFCYPADWSQGVYYVRDITGTTEPREINLGNWAIYTNNGKYYYERYTESRISLDFDIKYPPAQTQGWSGTGTEADPYQIATVADLFALSDSVNSAQIPAGAKFVTSFKDNYFKVTKAINLKGYLFPPIGGNDDMFRFGGVFDGDNKTISYLTVNTGTKGYAALFGAADTVSVIKNVVLNYPDVQVDNYYYAGSVVAYGQGKVENCKVTNGKITGALIVGGVCGSAGEAENLSFTGSVTGTSNIGGVIGNTRRKSSFLNATNTVVTCLGGSESYSAGGVVGYLTKSSLNGTTDGALSDSYFSGKVIVGKSGVYAGGVAGVSVGANVERCFTLATLSATGNFGSVAAGGIVGAIQNCTIKDCYFAGNMDVASSWGGSIAGYSINVTSSDGSFTHCYITNCYVSGQTRSLSTQAYSPYLGWFDTRTYGTAPTITNCRVDFSTNPRLTSAEGLTQLDDMTSDVAWKDFNTETWRFEKGFYPSLKSLSASTNVAQNVAKAPVLFVGSDNCENVSTDFKMPGTNSVKWQVLNGGKLTTAGKGLLITGTNPYEGHLNGAIATDTVVASGSNGTIQKYMVVKLAPQSMFEGAGTEENPYKINNKEDLIRLSEATSVNLLTFDGAHFLLTSDIDMEGDQRFKGLCVGVATTYKFGGIIDGGNHTLHGIKFNIAELDENRNVPSNMRTMYCGFIGRLKAGGAVKNLRMGADCEFNLWSHSGVFVADNYGDVINCRNYATVNAFAGTSGGIVGYNRAGGRVIGCYNSGAVNGGFHYMGGIVSYNYGELYNCQNDGLVTIKDLSNHYALSQYDGCGGIVLANFGSVHDCVNTGTVNGYKTAGGIVGWFNSTTVPVMAENSMNIGKVVYSSDTNLHGEIIGHLYKDMAIKNCVWDRQLSLEKAAENKDHEGALGLKTAVLTSGEPLEGFSNEYWQFNAGRYPMLKSFSDEPVALAAAQAVIDFGESENYISIVEDATLSAADGISWSLSNGENAFEIKNNKLEMSASALSLTDKIVGKSGTFIKEVALKATPRTLEMPDASVEILNNGEDVEIKFTNPVEDAVFYYTVDDTEPTVNSAMANPSAVIKMQDNFTLKAFASHRNYFDSPVLVKSITLQSGIEEVEKGNSEILYISPEGIVSKHPVKGLNIIKSIGIDGTLTITKKIFK